MIIEVDADLLEYPLDGFGHFCNCQLVMGGGIAYSIKRMYPEAYIADCKTIKGDRNKMGNFTYAIAKDGKLIVNCYTQFYYGNHTRDTDYVSVKNSLLKLKEFLVEQKIKTFGFPKNAGCGLGGGDWPTVYNIIKDIFNTAPFDLYICNYNG